MRAVDIIMKKRNGEVLTDEEIKFMVDGFTDGSIENYQMSAFTMAVYFRGMNDKESTALAMAMLKSGDELDLSMIEGIKVDKHSTGGVGDKTSLVVAPIVASLGIKFAKMSGRGLGHTGGTLDKLESIPGYNINMDREAFIKQVNDIGIALIGQTADLAPADKKLYSLRDVTATVESIPLIASSIMSKKLASGADAIVLDVKVGSGAFMKNADDARKLAKLMVEIGKNCGRDMTAVLTNMDEPLGFAVGNALEVIEAINTLNGNGPKDFTELCYTIASYLVLDAKKANTFDEAYALVKRQVENKEGLNTLAKLIEAQGGDPSYIYNPSRFKLSNYKLDVKADKAGYVSKIDCLAIGNAAMLLGAGRAKISDKIDHSVGIVINKKVNDYVEKNDVLATLYTNKLMVLDVCEMVNNAYEISDTHNPVKLIIDVVR